MPHDPSRTDDLRAFPSDMAFVNNLTDRIYPIPLTQAGNFLDEKLLAEGRIFGVSLQTAF